LLLTIDKLINILFEDRKNVTKINKLFIKQQSNSNNYSYKIIYVFILDLILIKSFIKTINLRVCHGKNILSFKYIVIKIHHILNTCFKLWMY